MEHLARLAAVPLRWQNIVIDCHDPKLVGAFWSAALGWPLLGPEDGGYWLEPGGDLPDILFLQVPEAKTVKNRVHVDLRPDDQSAEVTRLEALGARRVDIGQRAVTWVVVGDPEGNEFCVLSSRPEAAIQPTA